MDSSFYQLKNNSCTNTLKDLQKTNINNVIYIDCMYVERIKARQNIVYQYLDALDCLNSRIDMLNELYKFLVQRYLSHRYFTIFCLDFFASAIENLITNEKLPLTASTNRYKTLRKINRNVDEDFMMLLSSPNGDEFSLQSFVSAYPVEFDSQSKLGIKLRNLHQLVPGYSKKLVLSMDQYFSRLEPGNVRRRSN